MMRLMLGAALVLVGFECLAARPAAAPQGGFTVAQAEAGRVELVQNAFGACSDCHAISLATAWAPRTNCRRSPRCPRRRRR